MFHLHDSAESRAGLPGVERAPALDRLVATLNAAGRPTAPPQAARLDAAMTRALQARAAARLVAVPARSRRSPARIRLRLVSLVAALLLALSGVAGYLRLSAPTPAAAQTIQIVRHAARAMSLAPGQAAHLTYSVTVDGGGLAGNSGKASGLTGTADVWVQAGASGAPTLSAQTLSMDKPGMSSRFIQAGGQVYAYNPEMRGEDTIMINPGRGQPSWFVPNDVFDGAGATQELSALAARSPNSVQSRPRQTLDGHTVDVIEVDGWSNRPAQRTVFYFDAQSYVLRGFDASSLDPSYAMPAWQVRLTGYSTMPAASVPAATFTLNAPATAQVHLPDFGDAAVFTTFTTAYATACHGGANLNLKVLMRAGQSLLAACQAAVPGTTQDALVAALAAPEQATLDAAVASGQISAAQEANSLTTLRAWLTTWLTTTGGVST